MKIDDVKKIFTDISSAEELKTVEPRGTPFPYVVAEESDVTLVRDNVNAWISSGVKDNTDLHFDWYKTPDKGMDFTFWVCFNYQGCTVQRDLAVYLHRLKIMIPSPVDDLKVPQEQIDFYRHFNDKFGYRNYDDHIKSLKFNVDSKMSWEF